MSSGSQKKMHFIIVGATLKMLKNWYQIKLRDIIKTEVNGSVSQSFIVSNIGSVTLEPNESGNKEIITSWD